MPQLAISFVEFANLNVKEEKGWPTKNLTLKGVDVGFEPSFFTIRVSTSLLESFTILERTCTRKHA